MRKASPANPSFLNETEPSKLASARAAVGGVNAPKPQNPAAAESSPKKSSSLSLWLWVTAGYIFMSILWTVMFKVVGSANVQSVPLVTQGAKP